MKLILLLFFITSCAFNGQKLSDQYPNHWWKPVPKEDLKSWEISPESANRSNNEVILSKRNELGILSNFAHTPFNYRGKTYETVEGLWQSMKYPETKSDIRYKMGKWNYTRAQVSQMLGFPAKKAGDLASGIMRENKINWVTFENYKLVYRTRHEGKHFDVIKQAMTCKLLQNKKVKQALLKTGTLTLKADHYTRETDPPAWKYYKIWMDLRDDLVRNKKLKCKK